MIPEEELEFWKNRALEAEEEVDRLRLNHTEEIGDMKARYFEMFSDVKGLALDGVRLADRVFVEAGLKYPEAPGLGLLWWISGYDSPEAILENASKRATEEHRAKMNEHFEKQIKEIAPILHAGQDFLSLVEATRGNDAVESCWTNLLVTMKLVGMDKHER